MHRLKAEGGDEYDRSAGCDMVIDVPCNWSKAVGALGESIVNEKDDLERAGGPPFDVLRNCYHAWIMTNTGQGCERHKVPQRYT